MSCFIYINYFGIYDMTKTEGIVAIIALAIIAGTLVVPGIAAFIIHLI